MSERYEYYITGDDAGYELYGANWLAQTFTPSTAHTITSVKLKLYRYQNPGTLTVGIRATSGAFPTGSDLTSGTTNGDTLTTTATGEWREITLTDYSLSASTKYAIVLRALTANDTNYANWRYDNAGGYSDENEAHSGDSGTSWAAQSGYDFMFEDWCDALERNLTTSIGLSTTLAKVGTFVRSLTTSIGLNTGQSKNGTYVRSLTTSIGLSPSMARAGTFSRSLTTQAGLVASLTKDQDLTSWLCVASRDGSSVKTRNGTNWTTCAKDDSGVAINSSWLAQFDNRLCTLDYENSGFGYSNVNDIVANWAAPKPNFPNLPQRFTGMYVGRDAGDDKALYFLTPIGVYGLDVFTNFLFPQTEVTWEYDSTSGKKGIYWRGNHYIAVGKGIYQITGGVATPIGPDTDDGLPEDMQGTVTDMIGVGFWLVIAVDGDAGKKSSILKRYLTGNHWHTVYVGSVDTPIRALMWDSGTLYFGEGSNVKSLPFSSATDNVAKLSTHTYSASGDLIYPYFHSEFEAMPKVAHKIRGVTQDCDSNDTITIYYRTDSTTTWTELGEFALSPRPTALPFPASGDAVGTSFERIQFKASYARTTSTDSPKLESLTLEYRVVPPVLWGWDFYVNARTSGDQSGQDVINALKTAIETGTLLSFYPDGDKGGTEYFVEVSRMPGNESGTDFGQEAVYFVSVQEVID